MGGQARGGSNKPLTLGVDCWNWGLLLEALLNSSLPVEALLNSSLPVEAVLNSHNAVSML